MRVIEMITVKAFFVEPSPPMRRRSVLPAKCSAAYVASHSPIRGGLPCFVTALEQVEFSCSLYRGVSVLDVEFAVQGALVGFHGVQ